MVGEKECWMVTYKQLKNSIRHTYKCPSKVCWSIQAKEVYNLPSKKLITHFFKKSELCFFPDKAKSYDRNE